ncbi:WXG100 family type VII secretion target [Gordonia soli]|uniref:ESAT-6-like protein n=1 Tax=Gordonia soli NBRC 108243 TaxID=1223545 RepID=M0QIP6_9ACTN|nr:WXG100 family type VII secretion target [Gordonia soli]GAC68319.1 hypothetical protein GS4_14_01520 [Gordonia soli NBRC 108243]
MTEPVRVDPAVLWAAAQTISTTKATADEHLRASDRTLADCGSAWAGTASAGYSGFTTRMSQSTIHLRNALAHIAESTGSAAAGYEKQDSDNGVRVRAVMPTASTDTDLRL